MAVLEVKELTKKYGEGESEVIALDHVSFSVERGEFVAIIGASGSGKSTLMNMIGGIDYPTSGSIIIDGNEIQAMSEDELAIFRRRNLGIVYQFYNLIPTLTAEENIALPWKLDGRKENNERLSEIVNMLGLEKRAKHLPGQMSGGQQQRVSIGSRHARDPRRHHRAADSGRVRHPQGQDDSGDRQGRAADSNCAAGAVLPRNDRALGTGTRPNHRRQTGRGQVHGQHPQILHVSGEFRPE